MPGLEQFTEGLARGVFLPFGFGQRIGNELLGLRRFLWIFLGQLVCSAEVTVLPILVNGLAKVVQAVSLGFLIRARFVAGVSLAFQGFEFLDELGVFGAGGIVLFNVFGKRRERLGRHHKSRGNGPHKSSANNRFHAQLQFNTV